MKYHEIEHASRVELAEELAAAVENTEDWETAHLEELRERVRELLKR